MHPLRDIPLALGTLALLIGAFRSGAPICHDDSPQWLCKVVFYFVGTVLIGFSILGHYSPH
jgi:hypothetical protein